jgi:hypothetical protein
MNSKQLGLSEYNDIILSLYDANPIASIGDTVKTAPEEPKGDKPKSKKRERTSQLLKETYKLKLAAVANLKLTKRMFEYEKQRFKQLQVSVGKLANEDSEKSAKLKLKRKKASDNKKTKGNGLFRKMLQKMFGGLKRKFKTSLKRKIGPQNRKRLKNLRRNAKIQRQRRTRALGRPFRQSRRALTNLPGRTARGVTDLFTQAGRARSTARATRSYDKFIKGTANAGDKFRLLNRGLITPAQALSKGGPASLAQPLTPNIFRDSFDQLGKPLTAARDAASAGAEKISKGFSSGLDFFTQQKNRLFDFGSSKLDEARKAVGGKLDEAGKGLRKFGDQALELGKKIIDPKTYQQIYDDFVKKPITELGDKAKKMLDEFVGWAANHPRFKKIVESRVGKKVMSKLGRKVLTKLLSRLIVGLGTALAIWEAVERYIQGDSEGAMLSLLSAIPIVGIPALIVDICRELFPESYESIVSGMTGMTEAQRNEGINASVQAVGEVDFAGLPPGVSITGFAEGGLVPAKPQLVLVGEGGEEEFIVPKSKLSYFLGSESALGLMNYGAGEVFSAINGYLKETGLVGEAKSAIPELAQGKELPKTVAPRFGLSQIQELSGADKIKNLILETFKGIIDKIMSFVPDGLKNIGKVASDLLGNIANTLLGGPAGAATLPTSGEGAFATGLKTGASRYIGGSSDYHIDTKFAKSLSLEDRVKMMDKLAAAYAARGRKIEFSNSSVAGEVYDLNKTLAERMDLLRRAQSAHGHSRHSRYDSIDYYIPSIRENRFGKSAEAAEILVPTVAGGKVNYSQGGGYGAFITLTDEKGNVLLKTGHGDVRTAKTGSVTIPTKPINKDIPITPTPEPDPSQFVQNLISSVPSPQVLTVPVPMPSAGNQGTPVTNGQNYGSWGLNIFGN